MNNSTVESMIEAGGNKWEKGSLVRVYLDDESISKAFDLELSDKATYAGQFKSIGKSKVWFDAKKGTLHSDKGLVRSMFNQNGIKCVK